MPRIIDYLQSAVSDNTAHSQMDRLLLENEMNKNKLPQHTMKALDYGTNIFGQQITEPFNISKSISEGDFLPVGAGVKLFRGVPRWFRGKMVKDGRHVSPKKIDWGYGDEFVVENPSKKGVWATTDRSHAKEFAKTPEESGYILEYDVPKKFYDDALTSWNNPKSPFFAKPEWFDLGIPKEYLKKVSKGYQQGGPAERAPLLGYMNPVFNPEGSGYDMETALDAGLTRDEIGHMGSLDPRTSMVLKGKSHESWNPMVQTEMSLGNTVEYDPDKGRYFSVEGGMYNPAVQDETAHSQMDRLMFENELEQQPQHSMGVAPEPYEFEKQFVEGMMPVGGALKLLKGSKHWPSFQKNLSKVAAHEKKVHEVLQQTSQTPLGKLMDKGGSDKATKDYLTTLWIQRNLK